MSTILIHATWTFDAPLHVGSGLSSPAYADRIVRRSSASGTAEIDGEEVKGAIRLAAERLCCWYAVYAREKDESSVTVHPLLNRIFRNDAAVRYRFRPAACVIGERFRSAQTAIDPASGVADSNTLRVVENFASGASFNNIAVEAKGGAFDADVRFLILALILTESLGGKRTSGLGGISCSAVRYQVDGGETVEVTPEIAAGWVDEITRHIKEVPAQ